MPHINSNRRKPAAAAVLLVLLACLGLAACGGLLEKLVHEHQRGGGDHHHGRHGRRRIGHGALRGNARMPAEGQASRCRNERRARNAPPVEPVAFSVAAAGRQAEPAGLQYRRA